MYTEVKEAVNFLAKYLLGKIPRRSVSLFAQELANYLASRYIELWDNEEPKQKERDRVIRIRSSGTTDQLIITSAQCVGLDVDEIISYLPDNVMLYINPGEVYYKCSDRSPPCPIWMGPVNSDEDYRCLPACALQPHDKDSTTNMGAAGKTAYVGRTVYNDGVTPVEDPYIPLQLENVHPAAIDSPLKNQGTLKHFVFIPKDHKSYLVEDFAITRFGSHRNRPDHDVMRRIQQQAAMKLNNGLNPTMSCQPGTFEDLSQRTNQLPAQETEPAPNDILHRLTTQQREWLLKRLLELNFQENSSLTGGTSFNNRNNPGDGFSNLLASMPNLLPNGPMMTNRQGGLDDVSTYGNFGNFNDVRNMSNDPKRNWNHEWE